MSGKVTFVDHVADVEFEAEAEKLGDVFELCALTLFDIMMEEDVRKAVRAIKTREVFASGTDLVGLLYAFLEELIVLHDSEGLVFSKFSVTKIKKVSECWICEGTCCGETWNPERMTGTAHVKAVTYHEMRVEQDDALGVWKARVLLDI